MTEKLRALALAASPGPWRQEARTLLRVVAGVDDTVASCGTSDRTRDKWECNAAFIAEANPTTILALLDEIDRLKAENAGLIKALQRSVDALDQLTDKVDGTGFSSSDEFNNALDEIDLGRAAIASARKQGDSHE
jgi:hypothetical protein